MKLALFSDIHSNRQAFDACMDHARGQGAERFALLGDLVGYGADPRYIVQQAMALAAAGACVIGGNHDAMAVCATPPREGAADSPMLGSLGVAWTRAQLTQQEREFLAALPLTAQLSGMLLVHASADAPESWRYVDNAGMAARCLDAAVRATGVSHVFCGHVHCQTLYARGLGRRLKRLALPAGVAIPVPPRRRWVATVGSVGQPRDGDARAMYALLDTDRWQLRFERVPYAFAAAAAAIRATGALPEMFAARLRLGR
ncbi:metallophosphoesterase family protein [Verminephrobacter aporrectodeae]|uniref:Metallophosphoesterase n=1 Tax=Verminephrobacter aporrectodeae subsp. tuberculatae TaxID=1110392 RepID=A0ABT3KYB1_9BURK|nr:metallophosphoesterase family protein [Verminephrobacter aporrectodeae]MCW5223469.1 metallophosphoesterase [Verminephrobacter aporrectodeae subsp. tuberculatae]MCW5256325.1 metallophosphoesterase [Verminephrobacter aporrectodeae subsp. tuberculatae]MCW5288933.1 metallophosphoesterase [Verminephrobacter aporrectodeae subsp. tuberculatae]MCW5323319.1 metallophosphoesterase [Verminephrobacter aporrectodeae subsp. tuberculatae]MCW8165367.1 metallophosphoesterase [Verminephrobacter aporrectodeae